MNASFVHEPVATYSLTGTATIYGTLDFLHFDGHTLSPNMIDVQTI